MTFGMKLLTCAMALAASVEALPANAAPIVGSFSLASFGCSFIGGTAATATGLDFGNAFGATGNGYGTNGSAIVGNAQGSFAGLNGTTASISDISLATFANPFTANPFISFGSSSNIVLSFANAAFTRSPLGTSVTINGNGIFSDGIAADSSPGMFSLAVSSQNGMSSAVNFTFTSNASTIAAAVPEPATWAMMILGMGAIGFAMRRRNVTARVSFA